MADGYEKIRQKIADYKKVYGTDPPQEIRDKWVREIKQAHNVNTAKANLEHMLNVGKQIVGGGLMLGSTIMPTSYSPGITGAAGGAIYGAGDAIANNKPFAKTVGTDAAIGGALGVGLGKLAPSLAKGGKSVAGKVANTVEKVIQKTPPPVQQTVQTVKQTMQPVIQKVNQTLNKPLEVPTFTKKPTTSTLTPAEVTQKAIQQEPNYNTGTVEQFLQGEAEKKQLEQDLLKKMGYYPIKSTEYINEGHHWQSKLPAELQDKIYWNNVLYETSNGAKGHFTDYEKIGKALEERGLAETLPEPRDMTYFLNPEQQVLANAILEKGGVYPKTVMQELRTHVSPAENIDEFTTGKIKRDRLDVGKQGAGYFADSTTDLSGLDYVKNKYYVQQPKQEFFVDQDLPWEQQSEIVRTLADKLNVPKNITFGEWYQTLPREQQFLVNEYLNSQGVAGHTGTHPSWYASGHNEPFKEFVPFEGRTQILGNEKLQGKGNQ